MLILSKIGQTDIKSLDSSGCYEALGRKIHSDSGNACLLFWQNWTKPNRYKLAENRCTPNVRERFLTKRAGKVGKAFQSKQYEQKS